MLNRRLDVGHGLGGGLYRSHHKNCEPYLRPHSGVRKGDRRQSAVGSANRRVGGRDNLVIAETLEAGVVGARASEGVSGSTYRWTTLMRWACGGHSAHGHHTFMTRSSGVQTRWTCARRGAFDSDKPDAIGGKLATCDVFSPLFSPSLCSEGIAVGGQACHQSTAIAT